MATAIESASTIIKSKVHKKKFVILSIGTCDLRKGTPLFKMRQQFLTLYTLCQRYGLKPLVATIHCMDSPELDVKAKLFNDFLKQNFENVIDLFKAFEGGLAQSLANLKKT